MRTIKITTTQHYTKTAVVEIKCPEDLRLDEVANFLYDNEELYRNELEAKFSSIESEFETEESRFDVIDSVVLTKKVYGGSL